jgi:hypothetical protein
MMMIEVAIVLHSSEKSIIQHFMTEGKLKKSRSDLMYSLRISQSGSVLRGMKPGPKLDGV